MTHLPGAPAKIILFGEHAVVYGQPAIALPVSTLRATASITFDPNGDGTLRIVSDDLTAPLTIRSLADAVDDALAMAVRLAVERLGISLANATITIQSDIPVASGLGSGAAVSTAIVRAVAASAGRVLPNEITNAIVYEVERIFHGTPSGIDNTVIVYETPIYFVRNQPFELIRPREPLHFIIADSGIRASTKLAVGDVRTLLEAEPERIRPVIEAVGALVREAKDCIELGRIDRLGDLMMSNHELLQTLTVSSPELDALVAAALDGGAVGAKLSGGGRGGNMIALVTPQTRASVEAHLRLAGAARLHYTVLNPPAPSDETTSADHA